jgi:hypothetical protein
MKKNVFALYFFLIFPMSAHESFGLTSGQDRTSINYKLIKEIDLSKKSLEQLEDLRRPLSKFENKQCISSALETKLSYQFDRREYLNKKQRKARKSAWKKSKMEIRRKFANPSDASFNGMLEAGWYSIDGLQTCLIFFDKKLIAMYLGLHEHNIGQDFYKTLPISYIDGHINEHTLNKDKEVKIPSFQTDGYWTHGHNGWDIFFQNYYYSAASLHYSSKKGVDELVKYIAGFDGD